MFLLRNNVVLEVELMHSINKQFRKCWQNFVKTRFCFFYRLKSPTGGRIGAVPGRGDTQNVLAGKRRGEANLSLGAVCPSHRAVPRLSPAVPDTPGTAAVTSGRPPAAAEIRRAG